MSQLTVILITIPLCFIVLFGILFLIRLMLRGFDNGVKRHFRNSLTPEEYKRFEENYYGLEKAFDEQ